jgi:hypothetical protein
MMRRYRCLGDCSRRLAVLLDGGETAVKNCGLPAVFITSPGGKPASIVSVAVIKRATATGIVASQKAPVSPERQEEGESGLLPPLWACATISNFFI